VVIVRHPPPAAVAAVAGRAAGEAPAATPVPALRVASAAGAVGPREQAVRRSARARRAERVVLSAG
jgi:hypothetical protein